MPSPGKRIHVWNGKPSPKPVTGEITGPGRANYCYCVVKWTWCLTNCLYVYRMVLLSALARVMSHDCRSLPLVKYREQVPAKGLRTCGAALSLLQGLGNVMERDRRSMVIRWSRVESSVECWLPGMSWLSHSWTQRLWFPAQDRLGGCQHPVMAGRDTHHVSPPLRIYTQVSVDGERERRQTERQRQREG